MHHNRHYAVITPDGRYSLDAMIGEYRAAVELDNWWWRRQRNIPVPPIFAKCAPAIGVHQGCEHDES